MPTNSQAKTESSDKHPSHFMQADQNTSGYLRTQP